MAVRRSCRPRGRRAEYSARVLALLNEYPYQEFSSRQIVEEIGGHEPDAILFLTLLMVSGRVSALRRNGLIYYRKA